MRGTGQRRRHRPLHVNTSQTPAEQIALWADKLRGISPWVFLPSGFTTGGLPRYPDHRHGDAGHGRRPSRTRSSHSAALTFAPLLPRRCRCDRRPGTDSHPAADNVAGHAGGALEVGDAGRASSARLWRKPGSAAGPSPSSASLTRGCAAPPPGTTFTSSSSCASRWSTSRRRLHPTPSRCWDVPGFPRIICPRIWIRATARGYPKPFAAGTAMTGRSLMPGRSRTI